MNQPTSKPSPLILLVDDVLQNLEVLSEVLRAEGYRITGANSGPRALSLLERVTPDLILCDIMMPEMDGYSVVEELKKNSEKSKIPVIFLTAKSEPEDIIRGFEVGAVDYITKPFNQAELKARVKTHLDLKNARDTIAEQLKALEALNEEKDNMLSIAAHDLKNPLASVLLMTELMQMKNGDLPAEKVLDYANTIYQDADRMLLIITNLLDINKIESGRIQAKFQHCSLQDTFNQLKRDYQIRAKAKNINLIFEGFPTQLHIETDPLLLFQLLDNLLSNALKFSQSEKQIWVRLIPFETEIMIEIEDQGPGFSEQDQTKMFEKFARLSAKPTGDEKSTGLGLAIVKRLVDMLEGEISFKTDKNKGTCFYLKLKGGQNIEQ